MADESQTNKQSYIHIIFFEILALGVGSTILALLIIWNGLPFNDKSFYTITSCNKTYFSIKYNNAILITNIIYISTATLVIFLFLLFVSTLAALKNDSYHQNCTFGWLNFCCSVCTLATIPIFGYSMSLWLQMADCTIEWNNMSIMLMLGLGGSSCAICLLLLLMITCSCKQNRRQDIYKQVDLTLKTQQKQKQINVGIKKKSQDQTKYKINPTNNEIQINDKYHQKYNNSPQTQQYFNHKRRVPQKYQRNYNQNDYQDKKNIEQPSYDSRQYYDRKIPQVNDPFLKQKIQRNPHYRQESVVLNLHPSLRKMSPQKYMDYIHEDEKELYRQQKRYLSNQKRNIPINRSPQYNNLNQVQLITRDPYIPAKDYFSRNRYT